IAIFDLEGEQRKVYVKQFFARKGIEFQDAELEEILKNTEGFNNRHYDVLRQKVLAKRKANKETTVLSVLSLWRPNKSIAVRRQYQELVAADLCTFPHLIPERISKLSEEERSTLRTAAEFAMGS